MGYWELSYWELSYWELYRLQNNKRSVNKN